MVTLSVETNLFHQNENEHDEKDKIKEDDEMERIASSLLFCQWKRQFLCQAPWHSVLPWNPMYQTPAFQRTFLVKVLKWAIHHGLLPNFNQDVVPYLKKYFSWIEQNQQVVIDELYQLFMEVSCVSDGSFFSFEAIQKYSMVQKTVTLSNANELSSWFKEGYRKKTWWIQDTLFISLLEHSHWIHCGTTGLRTWPSELALIEFIYKHPELLSSMVKPNRPCRVLEIGAGTGLFSFFLSRFQPSFQLWVTDVHPEVLRLLHFNATTHHVTDGKKEGRPPLTSSRTTPSSSLPNFQIQAFDFVHQSFNELGHTMDLIVCADVMYDADTLPLYRNLPSDVPCLLAYPHRHQTNTTLSWLTSPTFDCQWQGKLSLFPSDEPFSNISIYSRHLPLFF